MLAYYSVILTELLLFAYHLFGWRDFTKTVESTRADPFLELPGKLELLYPYFCIDFLDEWRFMFNITLYIIGILFCPFFFYTAVFSHSLGMSPQKISKGNVSSQFR